MAKKKKISKKETSSKKSMKKPSKSKKTLETKKTSTDEDDTPVEDQNDPTEKADPQTSKEVWELNAEGVIVDRGALKQALEAALFASTKALSAQRLKKILSHSNFDTEALKDSLEELVEEYQNRGMQLLKIGGGYQFRSNPQQSVILRKILEDKPVRLSKSAQEVLAIVAYKQPITRAEIDSIRGIDSGHLMRGLLEKNLIRSSGHAETPGRPFLYATTPYFLEVFSLNSLDDLPSLEEVDRELNESTLEDEEAADFHDRPSALAADPDRGDFDEPSEEEVALPDFTNQEEEGSEATAGP